MIFIRLKKNFLPEFFNVKIKKPKLLTSQKNIYITKFFNRKLNVLVDFKKKSINKNWHLNEAMGNWIISKMLSISIRNFEILISTKAFIYFLLKFNKLKIFNTDKKIFILGPWPNNYFHQISDFIFRIEIIKKFKGEIYLPLEMKKIILSKPFKKIYYKNNLRFLPNNKIIYFNKIKFLTHVPHQKENYYLKKSIKILNNSINKVIPSEKKSSELIIIRRNLTSRRLINEDELIHRLKKYGFKAYNFEKMSIQQQIKLCRKSHVVIGYHGAGLTNCIFMKQNKFVLEISNRYIDNNCYKILSKCSNLNYIKSKCKTSYQNLSGECDIDKIENEIKKILSS